MCCDCKTRVRTCRQELHQRLTRALEILDAMKGDVFGLDEHKAALELYDLVGRDLWKTFPNVKAWCSVKHYARSKADEVAGVWEPTVWSAYANEATARREAARTHASRKKEHEEHPWWGSWEEHGDKFTAELTDARIVDLEHLKTQRTGGAS